MSLCIYAYHQAIIKIGAAIVAVMALAVAQCTLCRTVGITTTSRHNIVRTIVATITATTITTIAAGVAGMIETEVVVEAEVTGTIEAEIVTMVTEAITVMAMANMVEVEIETKNLITG